MPKLDGAYLSTSYRGKVMSTSEEVESPHNNLSTAISLDQIK